jgi:hypothetical protein
MKRFKAMSAEKNRQLKDLGSAGPATITDLHLLGITSVEQLKTCDARDLYKQLCQHMGMRMNICCLDVFVCAIEQAKNPTLPTEQKNWFYWSKIRKQASSVKS